MSLEDGPDPQLEDLEQQVSDFESLISSSPDFDELFAVLEAEQVIEGSERTYTAKEIESIVEAGLADLRQSPAERVYSAGDMLFVKEIPEAHGLRAKVIELVDRERSNLDSSRHEEVIVVPEYRVESPAVQKVLDQVSQRAVEEMSENMVEAIEAGHDRSFHNLEHAQDVKTAALKILDAIQAVAPNLIDIDASRIVAAAADFHDSVVNGVVNRETGKFQRNRGAGPADTDKLPENIKAEVAASGGGNEELSAKLAVQMIGDVDRTGAVFTREMNDEVRAAIDATHPAVTFLRFDPKEVDEPFKKYFPANEKGEVSVFAFDQNHLKPESSLSTLAVAIGDLSYVGQVSAEEFAERGNAEFREINEDIGTDLKRGVENLDGLRKSSIAGQMLQWVTSQVPFAKTQAMLFERKLDDNLIINNDPAGDAIKKGLRDLYPRFDNNLVGAIERDVRIAEKYGVLLSPNAYPAQDKLFAELAQELGY